MMPTGLATTALAPSAPVADEDEMKVTSLPAPLAVADNPPSEAETVPVTGVGGTAMFQANPPVENPCVNTPGSSVAVVNWRRAVDTDGAPVLTVSRLV
jgi:hypothetical protein